VENKLKHLFNRKTSDIYIVRHPEVENYAQNVFNGSIDVGVSNRGITQAQELFDYLSKKNIEVVYSSPMKRCRVVAERFESAGYRVIFDNRLRERCFGKFESKNWDQIVALYPEDAQAFLSDPFNYRVDGSESFADVRNRVIEFIESELNNINGNVLIIAHGGVNRIIISHFLKLPEESVLNISQDYACVNLFQTDGNFFLCKLLNGGVCK